jgi:hypothetical protein
MKYTLAVTSCDRHDLLKRTLQSFISCTSINPFETIIYEDSAAPRPAWLDEFGVRLGAIRWLSEGKRRGQAYAIDRLYSNIHSELVFHTEDDWEFHESGFLSKSFNILCAHPDISMVTLRSEWNHPLVDDPRGFKIAEPYWGGDWGGTCWNPGLRRLSDFRRFGNYGRHVGYGTNGLGHEAKWSRLHLDAGFRIACLPSYVRHIGEHSRACEPVPFTLPRILIAVPACQQLEYGAWESEQSPRFDKSKAHRGEAYGTDIHISGQRNDRITGVRDTWWKDVAAHGHHIDGRFFYGRPFAGAILDDEVVLDCGSDYASLPARTQEICRWALKRNYDYLFKCDDDTAVYVDRLLNEILSGKIGDYAGCENDGACTGGPGYILSRFAIRAVAEAAAPEHWAEDMFVAKVMSDNNIHPVSLNTHLPGYKAHWFWPSGYDGQKLASDTVSVHAVLPATMRQWYADISSSY